MDEGALEALRRGAGIAVDVDGVFTQHGRLVEHPRVQRLFHAGLAIRADGEVVLTVGPWWCYVEVARTAFFVEAFRRAAREESEAGPAASPWEAALLGGRQVSLAGGLLGYGPDGRIYLWAPELAGPAILLRSAHMQVMGALGSSDSADGQALGVLFCELEAVPTHQTPRPMAQAGLSISR